MVLNTMLWPDEIREPSFQFLDEKVEVREQELAMASSLIDSMTGEFHPDEYSDQYREALQEVIDAKVIGRQVVSAPEEEAPAPAADLMAALRASVERARAARGEEGPPVEPTPIDSARSRRAKADEGEKKPTKKATKKPTKKTSRSRKSA